MRGVYNPDVSGLAAELIQAVFEPHKERADELIAEAAQRQPQDCAEALKTEADRQLFVLPQHALALGGAIRQIGTLARQPRIEALGLMTTADALRAQGRYPDALAEYDRAGVLYLSVRDDVGWARTRLGSAYARVYTVELGPALEDAERARAILAEHGLWVRLARLESAIGNLLNELGRSSEALTAHERAATATKRIATAEERDLVRAEVNINRAAVYTRLDQYADAEQLLLDAAEVFGRYDRPAAMAIAESNLARSLVARGHVSRGLALANDVRQRMLEVGRVSNAASAGQVSVDCLLELNRPEAAVDLADAVADELAANGAGIELAKALLQRAVGYERLERYASAAADLEHAELLFRAADSGGWAALVRLQHAQVMERSGALDEALAEASTASHELRLRRQMVAAARADLVRASVYRKLGDLAAARLAARQARHRGVRLSVPLVNYQASRMLGELAEERGDNQRALREFTAAINALEKSQGRILGEQRAGFLQLDEKLAVYAAAIRLCVDQGDATRAFRFAERSKARALLDALALRAAGVVEDHRPDAPAAQRLSQELAALRRRHDRLTSALINPTPQDQLATSNVAGHAEILQRDLEQTEARIHAVLDELRLTEVGGIEHAAVLQGKVYSPLRHLDRHTALVQFAIAGDDIFVFVIRRGCPVAVQRAVEVVPQLLRLIRALNLNVQTVINGRTDSALNAQAIGLCRRLYDVLMRPIEERIVGMRRLVLVPHGVLHSIPFAALHTGFEYLIQRYELVLEPSASAISFSRAQRRTPDAAALVIAHSAGGRLPGAIDEGSAIADLLGADRLFEDRTSVDHVRAQMQGRRGVIHIAAHGHSRPDAPLFSHIQLADGQLTALDCLDLGLECELITLSACETGHAVVAAGDEPIGLTRSLLYAGARSVIQTLWRVDDAATNRLMTEMYARLRAGAGRAAALREAQCALFSGTETHPAFWAAFSLVGDWRPL